MRVYRSSNNRALGAAVFLALPAMAVAQILNEGAPFAAGAAAGVAYLWALQAGTDAAVERGSTTAFGGLRLAALFVATAAGSAQLAASSSDAAALRASLLAAALGFALHRVALLLVAFAPGEDDAASPPGA